MLIKTNSNGDEEWVRYIGGLFYDELNCVQQTTDGGYIITGCTVTGWSGFWDLDVWLVKTDSNGNIPRSRAINTPFNWLYNFLQSHPNLFPILRHLLGL
jgi:hypothetical protein